MTVSYADDGKYVTDVIAQESVEIIHNHDKTQPLFLLMSHAAVHTPVQAHSRMAEEFSYINCTPALHNKRQIFAGEIVIFVLGCEACKVATMVPPLFSTTKVNG